MVFDRSETRPGIEPRLAERPAERIAGSHRLDPPALLGQRIDQQVPKTFPIRVFSNGRLECPDDQVVATKRKIRFESQLHHDLAEFVEPDRFEVERKLIGEFAERGAPPELQRFLTQVAAPLGFVASVQRCAEQTLELERIDRRFGHHQPVGVVLAANRIRTEHLSQPGDVALQRVLGVGGRAVSPHHIGQLIGRNHVADAQHQRPEQGASSVPADASWPVWLQHIDRPQDPYQVSSFHVQLRLPPVSLVEGAAAA